MLPALPTSWPDVDAKTDKMAHWVFAFAVTGLLVAYLGNDKTVLHFRWASNDASCLRCRELILTRRSMLNSCLSGAAGPEGGSSGRF